MDIRNCKRCGKIYNYDGFKNCPTCRREDELDFSKVKEYIYENPGANISEVERETEVDSEKIIEFLRQGRLEIGDEHNLVLECEICKTGIKSGRFCDQCKNEIARDLGGAIKFKEKEEKEKRKETQGAKFRYKK